MPGTAIVNFFSSSSDRPLLGSKLAGSLPEARRVNSSFFGEAASRAAQAARSALTTLRLAARTAPFWLLAGTFFICGWTTNGIISTHFIPAMHDHGMGATTAAGMLAIVGIFDIAGTIDRVQFSVGGVRVHSTDAG